MAVKEILSDLKSIKLTQNICLVSSDADTHLLADKRITSPMAQASICTLYHTAIVKDRLPTGANLRIPTANPCSRLRVLFEGEVDLRLVSLPIAPSKQAPISGVRAQTPATKSPP